MNKKTSEENSKSMMEQLKSSSLIVSIESTGATDTKGIWTISIQTQKLHEAKTYIAAKVGIKI